MRASSVFSFEAGMSTVSCAAWIALRMRVRKSAMGSVMDMECSDLKWFSKGRLRLPGGLRHSRYEAVMGQLAQADATNSELAVHRVRASAAVAASICTCLVLRRARLLDAQRG